MVLNVFTALNFNLNVSRKILDEMPSSSYFPAMIVLAM